MKKFLVTIFLVAHGTKGDVFHYQNFLIGDRAMGLGGAFTALADDASANFYNPAGAAFALTNEFNASVNAFYMKKIRYKKALVSEDFLENSQGSLPSFFGNLQRLDSFKEGVVFTFGVYSLDSELKDQNDFIENIDFPCPSPCSIYKDGQPSHELGPERPPIFLERFHRTANQRSSTQLIGAGLAWKLASRLSMGAGVHFLNIDELIQEYQDVKTQISTCFSDGNFQNGTEQKSKNIRQKLTAYGWQPVIGIQMLFKQPLSLGISLKKGNYLRQDFEQNLEIRNIHLEKSLQDSVDSSPLQTISVSNALVSQGSHITKGSHPLGSMPLEMRMGLAYYPTSRFLTTSDIVYVAGAVDGEFLEDLGPLYHRNSVVNFSLGLEYYLFPFLPIRLGYFTNRDTRPFLEKNKTGQKDHIDYNGLASFLTWAQPGSQVGLGFVFQKGVGKSQKLGGSSSIQDVEARALTLAFSASHSL